MDESEREEAFVAWASAKESLKPTEAFLASYSFSSVKDSRFNHLKGLRGFLELTGRRTSLLFHAKTVEANKNHKVLRMNACKGKKVETPRSRLIEASPLLASLFPTSTPDFISDVTSKPAHRKIAVGKDGGRRLESEAGSKTFRGKASALNFLSKNQLLQLLNLKNKINSCRDLPTYG